MSDFLWLVEKFSGGWNFILVYCMLKPIKSSFTRKEKKIRHVLDLKGTNMADTNIGR